MNVALGPELQQRRGRRVQLLDRRRQPRRVSARRTAASGRWSRRRPERCWRRRPCGGRWSTGYAARRRTSPSGTARATRLGHGQPQARQRHQHGASRGESTGSSHVGIKPAMTGKVRRSSGPLAEMSRARPRINRAMGSVVKLDQTRPRRSRTALVLGGGGFTAGVYEIGALRALGLLSVNRTVNRLRCLRRHQRRGAGGGRARERHHSRGDDAVGARAGADASAGSARRTAETQLSRIPAARRRAAVADRQADGRSGARSGEDHRGRRGRWFRRVAAVWPLLHRWDRALRAGGPVYRRSLERFPGGRARVVPGSDRPRHRRADRVRFGGLERRADLHRGGGVERAADGLQAGQGQRT